MHTSELPGGRVRAPHGTGNYIPALDGWRAVAIMMVVLFHGFLNVVSKTGETDQSPIVRSISHIGALGVLIFFAISGYIITTRLYVDSRGCPISLPVFYLKRCFRILPAMWVYLLTLCALAAAHVIQMERADLSAPVFLTNYFPASVYTAHFWSLSVEEHFYLLWPLCLLFAGWRRALPVGAALFLAAGIYRAMRLTQLGVRDALPGVAFSTRGDFLSHTEARIDYILAGCMLALLLIFYPVARRFVEVCGTAWCFGLLLTAIFLLSRVNSVDVRSLQALLIALLVVSSSLQTQSLINRVLSHQLLVNIGKISYSLYLWQQLFLVRSSVPWLQGPAALLPRVGAALLTAWVSHICIERPAIRLGAEKLTRWQVVPMVNAGGVSRGGIT